jgi:hypothetical protein
MKKQTLLVSIIILVIVVVAGVWLVKKENKTVVEPLVEMPVVNQPPKRVLTEEQQLAEEAALARMKQEDEFRKEYYDQNATSFAMTKPIDNKFLSFFYKPYKDYDEKGHIIPNNYKPLNLEQLVQISASEYEKVTDQSSDLSSKLIQNSPGLTKSEECLNFNLDNGTVKSFCDDNKYYEFGYKYLGFSKDLNLHLIEIGGNEWFELFVLDQKDGKEVKLYNRMAHKYSADKSLLVSYSSWTGSFDGYSGISFVQLSNKYNSFGGYVNESAWVVKDVKIDKENVVYFKTESNSNIEPSGDTAGNYIKQYSYFKQVIK